jgi:hypothetical protein
MNKRNVLTVVAILALVVGLAPGSTSGQQAARTSTGKIEGTVYNFANSAPLVKATIEIVGKEIKVQTGVDGFYSISVEPGTYSVRFSIEKFNEQTIDDVIVEAGKSKEQNAVLSPVGFGETMTVTAGNSDDIAAMIEERKSASTISDTISATEISKDTASSAAGILARAPGISVVDRFVFVRGLGERYSNTSLNDALLPTTEPDRKVVPMDLIPANLLQSVKILKTFTPDQPGDFSGGLVRLDTVEQPRTTTLSVSFSTGFNSLTQGKDFLTYPGGGYRDFFGFGRGSRVKPGGIPQTERLVRGNVFVPGGFTPPQLEAIGESFSNIWEPRVDKARPELGWSIAGGKSFGKFGLVGALSFKNELQSQVEARNFYQVAEGNVVVPQHTYDYTSSQETARLGGTLNLTYEVTPNHKLYLKNFLTNQATDETRIFQGFNDDRRTDLRNMRLRYIEERIGTSQVSGNHLVSWFGNSVFTWRYTYSRATLDEPDLRESLYEFNPSVDDFIYFNQTQSLFRLYNEMRENVREPAADWAKYWSFGGHSFNTKVGASYINRDRLFDSRRFRFAPRGTVGLDTSQSPEKLLIPQNIGQDTGFEIREETRSTDHYTALHNIGAAYVMADFTLKKWRFVGGARVERSEQVVQTFEPFRPDVEPVFADLDDTDILPSLGIAYALKNGNMNIRAAFSRTVSRPQFRELSPFEFTDVTGGRSTIGNPDIRRTLITNYDVRWEWFFAPSQLLALSVFHKDLNDPIEIVIEPTAQLRTSFRNVDKARNTGIEIETRKNIGDWWQLLRGFSINANYTYVRSRVDIGEQELSVLTTLERPLVGQAENVANVVLNHDLPEFNFEWRALFNYTGRRITDVGALGLPDLIEHGYPHLDLLFARRFGTERKIRAEFTIENLLNRKVDFRQANQAFRVYKTGRTFTFGVSYRIF